MDISEAKTILLLAGEYRVLTNYYRALNPGSDVEIRAGYLETWLIIHLSGVKFDISVKVFLA